MNCRLVDVRFRPELLRSLSYVIATLLHRHCERSRKWFARRANVSQPAVLDLTPKSAISMRHPVPTRGALAIVTNAGRDAMDVSSFFDE
jgi:hypothetical protein